MSESPNPPNGDRAPDLTHELKHIRRVIGKLEELVEKTDKFSAAELAQALQQVIQAFKSLSEVQKSQAEIRKLQADEKKVNYDLEHAARQERSESRQRYVTLLTPLATTLILGMTLLTQSYQFAKSEHDKQDAAEDAQWSDAVKTISQSAKLSPVAVTLNPFLKSRRYADVARKAAIQALIKTRDPAVFADLFRGAFVPVNWANFDSVLQLDRALGPRLEELYGKISDMKKHKIAARQPLPSDDLLLLTPDERQDYDYNSVVIREISVAVLPLLKASRPQEQTVDLRSARFHNCDWSGVNLYGANIENINVQYANLRGADLGGVTSFGGAYLYGTNWWDAKRISHELLEHLIANSPYTDQVPYPTDTQVSSQSLQHYNDSILRLRK